MITNPSETKTNHTLIVKGSGGGGLGDRIRAVLVGCIYAELSGRKIFIDWSDGLYSDKGINIFEVLFEIKNLESADKIPDSPASVYPPAWSGRLHKSMDEVYVEDGAPLWNRDEAIMRYSFDLKDLCREEECLVMWEFDQLEKLKEHLHGQAKIMDHESLLRWAYERYLQPTMSINKELVKCFQGNNSPVIGVHVRATLEAQQQKGQISLLKYFETIDKLANQVNPRGMFLATDNRDVKEKILARYPIAWARDKWFPAPGEPLHLGGRCPDKFQAAVDAMIEMLILSRCDYLISVSNSSFSMLSRIMSPDTTKHLILTPHVGWSKRLKNRLRRLLSLQKN